MTAGIVSGYALAMNVGKHAQPSLTRRMKQSGTRICVLKKRTNLTARPFSVN
jgi:hypothetical protein